MTVVDRTSPSDLAWNPARLALFGGGYSFTAVRYASALRAFGAGHCPAVIKQVLGDVREDHVPGRAEPVQRAEGDEAITSPTSSNVSPAARWALSSTVSRTGYKNSARSFSR